MHKRGSAGMRVSRASRIYCVICKVRREPNEKFSRFGLCQSCAITNFVAQVMGMTHMTVTTESINGVVLAEYSGPVYKVA